MVERLRSYLSDTFFPDGERIASLVPMYHGRVLNIDISDAGVEVGRMRHRVHAHFQLLLLHDGAVNIGPMQRLWQNSISPDLLDIAPRGVRCNMELMETQALNYAIKDVTELEEALGVEVDV